MKKQADEPNFVEVAEELILGFVLSLPLFIYLFYEFSDPSYKAKWLMVAQAVYVCRFGWLIHCSGDEDNEARWNKKKLVLSEEDHDKAQDVAMQILNAVHDQRHLPVDKKTAISVSFTGSLESKEA